MSWEKVKLGEIAEFSNGINFEKNAYGKGIKLIGVSNFENRFYPDYDELDEVCEDVVRTTDCLENGDIIFVRSNGNKELVGRCMLIDNPPTKVTFSGFCIRARLKDLERHNPVFWSYHFKNLSFRRAMSGTAIGANIQNLSQGRLAAYEAEVPDIDTQSRIADILSKYDDLIENNQKQIKLLEEAAHRLYKEWFVDLRFPDYKECKIVDGVPEGWKKQELCEICTLKAGGDKPEIFSKDKNEKCSIPVFSNGTVDEGLYGYTNDATILKASVTISARGSVGYTCLRRVPYVPIVRLISVIPYKLSVEYLYLFLKNMKFDSNGAAQQQITVPMIKNMIILIPSEDIIKQFRRIIVPVFDKIDNLKAQNERLMEMRDRLLPKLISGEIEV